MWRNIVKWYREWEEEQLGVLEQPSLAAHAPQGYRRYFANKLASLSPIERQQLREFSIKYRGTRLVAAIAKLTLLFTFAGGALHVALSNHSLSSSLLVANMVGFSIVWLTTGAWFNYRWLVNRKRQAIVRFVSCAMFGVLLFSAVSVLLAGRPVAEVLEKLPRSLLLAGLFAGALMAVPLLIIGMLRNRHYEARTLQLQRDAERQNTPASYWPTSKRWCGFR